MQTYFSIKQPVTLSFTKFNVAFNKMHKVCVKPERLHTFVKWALLKEHFKGSNAYTKCKNKLIRIIEG